MDLSIIIPTLNRAPALQATLRSLRQQVSGYWFEVIVVDNGSTDHTREICAAAGKELPHFTYCYDDAPGMLTGRHKGAALAQAALLSFIDDDVQLNPGWVSSVVDAFTRFPDAALVGGPSLARYQVYPPAWLSYFEQQTPYGGSMCLPLSLLDLGAEDRQIDPLYVFGLNYSIRTGIFRELGGFHPDRIADEWQQYQGDGETGLSLKAKMKNYKALYVSSAFLYHLVPQERLQVAYFERWHYYSGICNSYTQIRNEHNLYRPYEKPSSKPILPVRILRKANRLLQRLKKPQNAVPAQIAELQSCFDRKYKEGYQFHQQAFQTDVRVKDWVLRSDYWNYKLPA